MTKRVLITGGAGYLGSIMTEHLLDRGYQVKVLDNLIFGQPNLFHFCANPNFDFVNGDARDTATMKEHLRDADVVIPLAALVGAPACKRDPLTAKSVNYGAIKLLTELRSRDQLILYPNTNSGYGTKSGETFCTEESSLDPISLYGITKVDAEKALLDQENTLTFRLATVFGASPRMRLDLLVNHFTYAAVTDGYIVIFEKDFKRNYIHIRDVADAFIHGIENADAMVGQPYNLGLDDANLSKEELANLIKSYVPSFYLHFGEIGEDPDKRNYIVSNQRLREAGFEASRNLDFGVQELLKAYRTLGRGRFKNI